MNILASGAEELGLALTANQLEQFETYYRELVGWNERINLTAITDYEEVQSKHFLDSLTVMAAIRPADRARSPKVIDVGTGAGLPGIPLKIVLPHIRLTLLEATGKKTRFLNHLVTQLGLKDVAVVTGRAEAIGHDARHREAYDVALSRALAPLPALAELTLPLCAVGGYGIAMKKGDIDGEIKQSQKAIETLGGALKEIRPVELSGFKDNRVLVIIDKLRPTPAAYPRRPGVPEKRPIKG